MKPQYFVALAGTLIGIALILLITGGRNWEAVKGAVAPLAVRTVTVTGQGEVRVKPDLAHIEIGVMTPGASAPDAGALNLASAKRIGAAMVTAGAEQQGMEIGSSGLESTTHQDYAGNISISGFMARTVIRVQVNQVPKVQAVIDAALAAGATSVENLFYTLNDPEPAKQVAMKRSLDNAKARAQVLVRAEGASLGELRSMEVLNDQAAAVTSSSPQSLSFRASLRATFEHR